VGFSTPVALKISLTGKPPLQWNEMMNYGKLSQVAVSQAVPKIYIILTIQYLTDTRYVLSWLHQMARCCKTLPWHNIIC
jgi:hypothetical protein